jgi:MFS transporter, DHA2 family, multidrug resistance protein
MNPPRADTAQDRALLISVTCMMIAAFMQFLDTSVVYVTLPYMRGSLSAASDQITWVATSYIIATAVFLPLMGHLSNRYGHKAVFLVCVAVFTLASVCCGAARSLEQIVLFRILQGGSGAGIIPTILSVIVASYEGRERARMMAIYGALSMLGPIAGPLVGGYLTEYLSWRWVFWINAPLGLLVIAVVNVLYHGRPDHARDRRFDVFGTVILGLTMGLIQLILDRGNSRDWFDSTEIMVETLLAGVGMYVFIVHMATAAVCVVPVEVMRNRLFMLSSFISTLGLALQVATITLIPPFLQSLGNYSVLQVGLTFVPRGLGAISSALVGVRLMSRVDGRTLLLVGWAFSAWSLWDMAHWTPEVDALRISLAFAANGFGLSIITMNCNVLAFASLRRTLVNEASAIYALIRSAGSAALIAITVSVLVDQSQRMHAAIAATLSARRFAENHFVRDLLRSLRSPSSAALLDRLVNRNAQIVSYADSYLFLFAVGCLVPIAVLMLGRPHASEQRVAP